MCSLWIAVVVVCNDAHSGSKQPREAQLSVDDDTRKLRPPRNQHLRPRNFFFCQLHSAPFLQLPWPSIRHNAMDGDSSRDEDAIPDSEETQNLLANSNTDTHDHDDLTIDASKSPTQTPAPLRQSSLAQYRPDGTPRTPNRVRFDMDDSPTSERHANGSLHPDWVDDEDFLIEEGIGRDRRQSDAQRLPLLTDIEAPSVTVALEHTKFHAEEHLENARPKSGVRSAFMNMTNSIM